MFVALVSAVNQCVVAPVAQIPGIPIMLTYGVGFTVRVIEADEAGQEPGGSLVVKVIITAVALSAAEGV